MHRSQTLAATSLLGLSAVSVCAGEVDARLDAVLRDAAPDQTISVLVELDDQADLTALDADLDAVRASRHERHDVVVRELQHRAAASQPAFLDALEPLRAAGGLTAVRPFWIANVVRLEGTPDAVRAVATLPGVERVVANPRIESIAPVGAPVPAPVRGSGTPLAADDPEIGLEVINAPEAWALGYTGTGILVAVIDSGVDGNHPALASRWAGLEPAYAGHPEWAFFDPYLGMHDFPYDDVGHGTHVTGSLCGGAPGDTIGVAPDIRWIAAAAIDRGGTVNETIGDLLESMQWVLDPDGDPGTSFDFPHVCSNSWGPRRHASRSRLRRDVSGASSTRSRRRGASSYSPRAMRAARACAVPRIARRTRTRHSRSRRSMPRRSVSRWRTSRRADRPNAPPMAAKRSSPTSPRRASACGRRRRAGRTSC